MSKLRYLLAGLVAALAFAGCGDTITKKEETVQKNMCEQLGTVCNDPTGQISCDPADGQCKCGGANGNGIACGEGEVCRLNNSFSPPAPTCVSVLCEGVSCDTYESCDANDGLCKCDGLECPDDWVCNAQRVCEAPGACDGVVCRNGETCDPADRTCKCGDSICSVGESCRTSDDVTQCVGRRCVGMNCAEGSECNPVDGLCHCGSASGPACTAGQACVVDLDTGVGSCEGHDICEGVICTGGTTCSPLDGECRCGGYDTAAPICGAGQTCNEATRQCEGGDVCAAVQCDPGSNTSCDEEQGVCKCGGTGGVICEAEEGCVATLEAPLCVTRCNPLAANVEVEVCGQIPGGPPMGCYFSPADRIAFCATAGDVPEGQECESITDCASGSHCIASGDTGVCRAYCRTGTLPGEDGACYAAGTMCVPIEGADAVVEKLGACRTVAP